MFSDSIVAISTLKQKADHSATNVVVDLLLCMLKNAALFSINCCPKFCDVDLHPTLNKWFVVVRELTEVEENIWCYRIPYCIE